MSNTLLASRIADRVLDAETPEPFEWKGRLELGPGFTPTQRTWFDPPARTAYIRRYHLANVELDTPWTVLFRDAAPLLDSKYLIFDQQFDNSRIDPQGIEPQPDSFLYVLSRNNGFKNYYHWLAQVIPAIEAAAESDTAEGIALALPPLSRWHEDMLLRLGVADLPRLTLDPGKQYSFRRLEFSEYLTGQSSFQISRVARRSFQRIGAAVPQSSGSAHDIIYVARSDSAQRPAGNEPDLIDRLAASGVRIIVPSEMTFDEQVQAFRGARIVIGAHGAGLSNVGFCVPGACLYEFFPAHYVNPCINKIAQGAGMDYIADCFTQETRPEGWVHDHAWQIDIDQVLHRVDQIREGRPAASNFSPHRPLREILIGFESLGDNCEFGLVQRQVGAEPISLLRFASPFIPAEQRPRFIADAISRSFEGLGDPDTITVTLAGEPGRREYLLTESVYHLMYHTFRLEGEIDPDEFRPKEARRLCFLRDKLMNDLRAGEKLWVWKSNIQPSQTDIDYLLQSIRKIGPNSLLWVDIADDDHPPGSLEHVGPYLLKGYVDRFASYDNAGDISYDPWFSLCLKAHAAWNTQSEPNRSSEERIGIFACTYDRAALISKAPFDEAAPDPSFTDQQRAVMVRTVAPLAKWITLAIHSPGNERRGLVTQLRELFESCGVTISIATPPPNPPSDGFHLTIPIVPTSESAAVFEALSRSGLLTSVRLDSEHRMRTSAEIAIGPTARTR